MIRKMKLEVWLGKSGGGQAQISQELIYEGDNEQDIAKQIDRDNNKILEYMETGDFKGEKCFCLQGFMIKKSCIAAVKMTEADF